MAHESLIKYACLWFDTRRISDSMGPFLSHMTVRLSSQVLQQRLGVLQVGGVKAFGEPIVDRGE